jgi:hypothetical protein
MPRQGGKKTKLRFDMRMNMIFIQVSMVIVSKAITAPKVFCAAISVQHNENARQCLIRKKTMTEIGRGEAL